MCLVEMEKSAKPIASCAMPATEGMNIKTNTALVEKARKRCFFAKILLIVQSGDQGGMRFQISRCIMAWTNQDLLKIKDK